MPVFISHRTKDDEIARAIWDRLTNVHRIKCYLDDLDREISTRNITSRIVSRVEECTNLLALVTPNTKGSWWVPFEVGVAREAPRVITSFTNLPQYDLPEYLTEWPVLRGNDSIDKFAAIYRSQAAFVKQAMTGDRTAASSITATVDHFHRSLKTSLGQ